MVEQIKQQTGITSEEGESKTSSSVYEYWKDKKNGQVWSVRRLEGNLTFSGPLNKTHRGIPADKLTYTTKPEFVRNKENFEKITYTEMMSILEGLET